MVEFINPLDLESIFVDTFAGGANVFIFVFALVIAGLAGKFRMPNTAFLVMLSLGCIIVGARYSWVLALVVILSSVIIFYMVGRIIKS